MSFPGPTPSAAMFNPSVAQGNSVPQSALPPAIVAQSPQVGVNNGPVVSQLAGQLIASVVNYVLDVLAQHGVDISQHGLTREAIIQDAAGASALNVPSVGVGAAPKTGAKAKINPQDPAVQLVFNKYATMANEDQCWHHGTKNTGRCGSKPDIANKIFCNKHLTVASIPSLERKIKESLKAAGYNSYEDYSARRFMMSSFPVPTQQFTGFQPIQQPSMIPQPQHVFQPPQQAHRPTTPNPAPVSSNPFSAFVSPTNQRPAPAAAPLQSTFEEQVLPRPRTIPTPNVSGGTQFPSRQPSTTGPAPFTRSLMPAGNAATILIDSPNYPGFKIDTALSVLIQEDNGVKYVVAALNGANQIIPIDSSLMAKIGAKGYRLDETRSPMYHPPSHNDYDDDGAEEEYDEELDEGIEE